MLDHPALLKKDGEFFVNIDGDIIRVHEKVFIWISESLEEIFAVEKRVDKIIKELEKICDV